MDTMIREFALQMLRKLQLRSSTATRAQPVQVDVTMANGDSNEDDDAGVDDVVPEKPEGPKEPREEVEDGQLPQEDLVQTPYLPERIELPAKKAQVLQHVELLFALSVKVPEFLDEFVFVVLERFLLTEFYFVRIFSAYVHMDLTVQEAIQDLITALIRSLGSNHGKLLTLMRQCPPGAESLALRVLTIFTEYGRPSSQLVALVKALINERNLDARFLTPIIAEMDKVSNMLVDV